MRTSPFAATKVARRRSVALLTVFQRDTSGAAPVYVATRTFCGNGLPIGVARARSMQVCPVNVAPAITGTAPVTAPESPSGASNVATLNAVSQTLEGAILVGENSSLTLSLTEGSALTGSVSGEIVNSKGDAVSAEAGTVSVTLDDTSTWTLTADSWISEFNGNTDNVITNGYTLYVNGVAM